MTEVISSFDSAHTGPIHSVAFNLYSTLAATASSDQTIRLWEIDEDGRGARCIQDLTGHSGPVWQVAWGHPSFGQVLASCGYDKRVIIWSQQQQRGPFSPIFTDEEHSASVNSVAFAPEAAGLVLAAGSSDGYISILTRCNSVASGWKRDAFHAHANGVNAVAWTCISMFSNASTGNLILASAGNDNSVRLWHLDSASQEWRQMAFVSGQSHSDWVRDVSFQPPAAAAMLVPSSLLLASCSEDKTVKLWIGKPPADSDDSGEVAKNRLSWHLHQTLRFDSPVWRISWSIGGTLLAVASGDDSVILFRENVQGVWSKVADVADKLEESQQQNAMAHESNGQVSDHKPQPTAGAYQTPSLHSNDPNNPSQQLNGVGSGTPMMNARNPSGVFGAHGDRRMNSDQSNDSNMRGNILDYGAGTHGTQSHHKSAPFGQMNNGPAPPMFGASQQAKDQNMETNSRMAGVQPPFGTVPSAMGAPPQVGALGPAPPRLMGGMPPLMNAQGTAPPPMGSVPPQVGSLPPAMGGAPPAMGGAQPPMGGAPPPMGGAPPSMGVAPPHMGSAPPPIGTALPHMGTAPPTMGVSPPSMGSAPPPMGVAPPPMSTAPPPMGNAPPPMGNAPPPMGTAPPPVGVSPPHMGTVPSPVGVAPPHMGTARPPVGVVPPHMGTAPPPMGISPSVGSQAQMIGAPRPPVGMQPMGGSVMPNGGSGVVPPPMGAFGPSGNRQGTFGTPPPMSNPGGGISIPGILQPSMPFGQK